MTYGPSGCSSCGGAEKLAALTDALSQSTTYTYDTAGRMVTETDPLTRSTAFAYNSRGKLTSRIKPDNRTITYVYDAAGRILEKHYPDNTMATYSYDQNGNMITAANQNISFAFTYDVNNRLTGVTDSFYHTVNYQYDAAGNRTSMTSPEGLTTTYTYNNAGRLTGTGNFAGNFTLTYDAAGRRTQLAYPNGATAAYTYDANGNLTLISHANSGGITLSATSYTYNSINNRTTRNTSGYTYDAVSRLTYSTAGENYTYDGVGNRLTGPLSTDTMSYNAGNEQQNINATQFTYDLNGNRIQKTEGGVTTTYTYDDENRLTEITRGADTIIYAYDPLGRRIAKSVNNVVTWYVYDGNAIIAAYDLSGAVTARYSHGLNIDEPLAVQQGSVTSFYHADGLGSIVALTNAAGSVVQTYNYDSFGNITQSGGINQPFTYTAREYDTESGLYFYRARYYDPKAGRFIARDPIGFEGGINQYAYVLNNPGNWIDPYGFAAFWYHFYDGYRAGLELGMSEEQADALGRAAQNPDFSDKYKNEPWAHATTGSLDVTSKEAINNALGHAIEQWNTNTIEGMGSAIHIWRDVASHDGSYFPLNPSITDFILHIIKYDLLPGGQFEDVIGRRIKKNPCK